MGYKANWKALRTAATTGMIVGAMGFAACSKQAPEMLPPAPTTTAPAPQPTPSPVAAAAVMQVVRGSADAITWYPIGRRVAVDARICLPATARFITFERLDGGGQITYGGGECNKRVSPPAKGPERDGRRMARALGYWIGQGDDNG